MKKIIALLVTMILPFTLIACGKESKSTPTEKIDAADDSKVLVAYFSYSGNTRKVAEQIHNEVGGDIFEIKTTYDYPSNYDDVVDKAKEEQNENARPELNAEVSNMEDYDVVFLGYPNWWYNMPMALYSFLDKYDLSGKTVIPFCTHGGSGFSDTIKAIEDAEPNAKVVQGIDIRDKDVDDSDSDVSKWVKDLGMAK